MGSQLSYDIREVRLEDVRHLFEEYHGYRSVGRLTVATYAVYEHGLPVAAYVWQPPAPGAAKSACPGEPAGVLALSRMVAVPREARQLNHVSKPLRRQMRKLLDRGRWPVLITYSDEGQGHTGHVYRCSGWHATTRKRVPVYETEDGARASRYSNGSSCPRVGLRRVGWTYVQRWEHWACDRDGVPEWMRAHGWVREPIPGKVWRSGNQAHRWVCRSEVVEDLDGQS